MPHDENAFAPLFDALSFAAAKHRDQRRKGADASPYINHPIEVANLLVQTAGVRDPAVLCAAILHDTVEDTQTTPEELRERFGQEVASIVAEVTDDKKLPKATRKKLQVEHAPHLSKSAKLVKLADKVSNLRDVNAQPPVDWPLARRQEYFDWAKQVVAGLRGVNAKLEAAFDDILAKRPV